MSDLPIPEKLRYHHRKAVLSPQGPKCSTCRLICLALNHRMNTYAKCFPSMKTIAKDTHLSKRTIQLHMHEHLIPEGWILREIRGKNLYEQDLFTFTGTFPSDYEDSDLDYDTDGDRAFNE